MSMKIYGVHIVTKLFHSRISFITKIGGVRDVKGLFPINTRGRKDLILKRASSNMKNNKQIQPMPKNRQD